MQLWRLRSLMTAVFELEIQESQWYKSGQVWRLENYEHWCPKRWTSQLRQRTDSSSFLIVPFCTIKTLDRLGDAHSQWWGLSFFIPSTDSNADPFWKYPYRCTQKSCLPASGHPLVQSIWHINAAIITQDSQSLWRTCVWDSSGQYTTPPVSSPKYVIGLFSSFEFWTVVVRNEANGKTHLYNWWRPYWTIGLRFAATMSFLREIQN